MYSSPKPSPPPHTHTRTDFRSTKGSCGVPRTSLFWCPSTRNSSTIAIRHAASTTTSLAGRAIWCVCVCVCVLCVCLCVLAGGSLGVGLRAAVLHVNVCKYVSLCSCPTTHNSFTTATRHAASTTTSLAGPATWRVCVCACTCWRVAYHGCGGVHAGVRRVCVCERVRVHL